MSQGITVYLTQGDDVDLSVEADENIIDLLITEVQGDVLKIYFEKNVNLATRNVYLTVESINELRTNRGSIIKSEGVFSTKSLSLHSSSGSSITINVDAIKINTSTSSGANMSRDRCKMTNFRIFSLFF